MRGALKIWEGAPHRLASNLLCDWGSSCYLRLDGQVFFLSCLGEKANAFALISALMVPFSQKTDAREKLVEYLNVTLLHLATNHQLLGIKGFKLNNNLGFFAKLFIHLVQMLKNPQRMPIPHISQQQTSTIKCLLFLFLFPPEILKHLQPDENIYSSSPTFAMNGSICT